MPPSISRRVYIKWLDASGHGTASEPTSTIVLTDPASGAYVDVRIRQTALSAHPPHPDTNHSPPPPIALKPSDVEWAFAGISRSTPLDKDHLPFTRRATFTHEIDSRDAGPDEGDMRPAADSTADEIEVGEMTNPDTGVVQRYEERWAEEEILEVPGAVERSDGRRASLGKVMYAQGKVQGEGGRIFHLGRYVQSVLKWDGKLFVERWVWTPGEQAEAGDSAGYWSVARLGEPGVLPDPGLILKNSEINHSGIHWTMKGAMEW